MIIRRKLGPKGQLLLPKDIRELLGVKPGEDIYIEVNNDEVRIRAATDLTHFLANFYDVPKKLKEKINIEREIEEEYDLR